MQFNKNGKELSLSMSLNESLDWAKKACDSNLQNSKNTSLLKRAIRDRDTDSFSGGTYEDLFSRTDLAPFIKAKSKMGNATLLGAMGSKPRRKRFYTEFDGDFCFERRDSEKPYEDIRRERRAYPLVTLNIYPVVPSFVKSEDINIFGAYIWALIQKLEASGKQCKLDFIFESIGTSLENNNCTITVTVKNHGEYVEAATIAKALTSNYFRRLILGAYAATCDKFGAICSSGMGMAKTRKLFECDKNGHYHIALFSSDGLASNKLEKLTENFGGKHV